MSKVKRGTAAEFIAKAMFLLEGWDIYDEVNNDTKVDFIISKEEKYFRIQVKCVTNENLITFRKLTHSKTTHKQHHYSCKDVDFFVGVDLETFDLYIIPITKINRSSIKIQHVKEYKNNFKLGPCCGNIISAFPQVGEAFDNGNTELVPSTREGASVETLRETSKGNKAYDEDKVQTPNIITQQIGDYTVSWVPLPWEVYGVERRSE